MLLNTNGYYDQLLAQLGTCIAQDFTAPPGRGIYQAAPTPALAVEALCIARPPQLPNKIKDAIQDEERIRNQQRD